MNHSARTATQIGAIIRRERRRRKLTQAELGNKVGLRQATISKLEAGEPATRLSTLLDTLTALGLQTLIGPRGNLPKQELEDLF